MFSVDRPFARRRGGGAEGLAAARAAHGRLPPHAVPPRGGRRLPGLPRPL